MKRNDVFESYNVLQQGLTSSSETLVSGENARMIKKEKNKTKEK